jgi:hypothetical protein
MHCGPYIVGDTVTESKNSPVEIQVEKVLPQDRIRLISQRGIEMEAMIDDSTWQLRYSIADQMFIRVEIHRYRQDWEFWLPILISNPIYFTQETGDES